MNHTHFLPAQKMHICQKEGGYFLKMDGQKMKLAPPKRALPITNPSEYIMLCGEDGTEIGILRSLDDLDEPSRERLGHWLESLYRVIYIFKVLDIEREPLSGRIRWQVEVEGEVEGTESDAAAPDAVDAIEERPAFRLLRRSKAESSNLAFEPSRQERTFFISGAEDVQTARYPRIFLADTDGNRYEIPNYEALDLASRRLADQYM